MSEYAGNIFEVAKSELNNDCSVFVTDGTVCRRVTSIDMTDGVFPTLSISTEGSGSVYLYGGLTGWVEGWGLLHGKEGLYIAPDWWIAL